MNKFNFSLFLLFIIFSTQIIAQNSSELYKREVIVWFKENILVKPAGKTAGTPDEFQINSSAVENMLQTYNSEFISQLIPGFTSADRIKTARTGEQVILTDWTDVYVLRLTSAENIDKFVDELNNSTDVILVEKNGKAELFFEPNDEHFFYQWALKNNGTIYHGSGTVGADIRAAEAWDIERGESWVNVAVIDGGIDANHVDLSGRVSGDISYSGSHGTQIAGIIGAKTNNGIGIAGVANVGIINERVDMSTNQIIEAIYSAINRDAHIINASWGSDDYEVFERLAFSDFYKINNISVAAMGNSSGNIKKYPAGFGQGIISVGASDNGDARSEYSNYGYWIDIVAPSGKELGTASTPDKIKTTHPGNGYSYFSGTSAAAPHVSGVVALLISADPNGSIILDNDDVEKYIQLSAEDKGDPGFDEEYGHGRLDARKALDLILEPYEHSHRMASGGTVYGSPVNDFYWFYGVDGLVPGTPYIVKRYEVRKTVTIEDYPETKVWGRGFLTKGYSNANSNFGMGWCEVISTTSTTATLRTYVYEVWEYGSGYYLGWYPCQPSQVYLKYTINRKISCLPPENLTYTWSNDHPKPQWEESEDPNIDHYEVWKYKNVSWSLIGTTTNNYYVDESETRYSVGPGSVKEYVDYKVRAVDEYDLTSSYTNSVRVTVRGYSTAEKISTLISTEENKQILTYNLDSNYPNPFNPYTTIVFSIPEKSIVTLSIYNIEGKEIETLIHGQFKAGVYPKSFNGERLSSGLYFYRLNAKSLETEKSYEKIKRMLIIK